MTRTDTVTGDSADFCGTTRVLTKKCNKKRKSKYIINFPKLEIRAQLFKALLA